MVIATGFNVDGIKLECGHDKHYCMRYVHESSSLVRDLLLFEIREIVCKVDSAGSTTGLEADTFQQLLTAVDRRLAFIGGDVAVLVRQLLPCTTAAAFDCG